MIFGRFFFFCFPSFLPSFLPLPSFVLSFPALSLSLAIFLFFDFSPKRNVFKVSMIHVEPAIHKKLSQFAAFFIETEVEISVVESWLGFFFFFFLFFFFLCFFFFFQFVQKKKLKKAKNEKEKKTKKPKKNQKKNQRPTTKEKVKQKDSQIVRFDKKLLSLLTLNNGYLDFRIDEERSKLR